MLFLLSLLHLVVLLTSLLFTQVSVQVALATQREASNILPEASRTCCLLGGAHLVDDLCLLGCVLRAMLHHVEHDVVLFAK